MALANPHLPDPGAAGEIFDDLPIPAFVVDAAGRLTAANQRFRAAFPNANPGDTALPMILDAATMAPDEPPLRRTRETGAPAEAQLTLDTGQHVSWLRMKTAPHRGGAVATLEDLTEHRRLEQRLRSDAQSAARQLEQLDVISDRLLDTRRILQRKNKELETAKAELERLSNTDALTGLWNRRQFDRVVEQERLRAERYRHPVALLMLDIDFFKKVNDTWGHPAGDEVLREVARLVAKTLRETDVVARIGGEEFAALLTETDRDAARATGERVRVAVEAAVVRFEETDIRVTVSVGVAATPEDPFDDLLARADQRLYLAKRGGRNRVVDRDA